MKKWFNGIGNWLWAFLLAVAVVVVYKTFDNFGAIWSFFARFAAILTPFIAGFVIAFLLYSPANALEKFLKKHRWGILTRGARGVSVLAVYLVLIAALTLLAVFGIPALATAVTNFVSGLLTDLPKWYNNLLAWLQPFTEQGGLLQGFDLNAKLTEFYNYMLSNLTGANVLTYFGHLLTITSSLMTVVLSFVLSIYLLASRDFLFRIARELAAVFMKKPTVDRVASHFQKAAVIFHSYYNGVLLDAVIVGTLATVGLLIGNMPGAIPLGILVGLSNLIPYFGAIISSLLCVVLALLSGNPWLALYVAVYLLVMQQVDANVIQPRIAKRTTGVKPVIVLLAITVFGGFFGLWGILISVPTTATIGMLIKEYLAHRRRIKGEEEEEQKAAETAEATPTTEEEHKP